MNGKASGMLESGKSVAEVSEELIVSERTVLRWRSNDFQLFDKHRSTVGPGGQALNQTGQAVEPNTFLKSTEVAADKQRL